MSIGFCVRCNTLKEIQDPVEVTRRVLSEGVISADKVINNEVSFIRRPAIKGRCQTCGTVIYSKDRG